jgi:cyclophilin family peptidyl-prolyl cis-trans isomerase
MATSKRERQKAARRIKIEQMQRQAKRRQNIRRGIIFGIVAVLILGAGTLLFSSKNTTTTTTTVATTSTLATTTTTGATPTTIPKAQAAVLQAAANKAAVAAGCPASTTTRVNNLSWSKAPALTIDKTKTYDAHFVTTAGDFVVQLDAATAPITTNNFVFLAEHDFYKCVIFHRVIPGFVIQGGDPTGTGTSGPGYTIADEYPKKGNPTYPLYSVAMANTGSAHSGGSQFFIVTGASGEALPNTYSLFGQVISGQSVVAKINNEGNTGPASDPGVPPVVTNRMLSVTITES